VSACIYWVGSDAAGHRCNAAVVKVGLCAKHFPIELERTRKLLAEQEASRARTEQAWKGRNAGRLPAWRVNLERAEAEYARRTASPVNDRAAVGGNIHGGVVRSQQRHLSDSNVARVVELERIIQGLRADIARMERST
jgi:hypothetical protein